MATRIATWNINGINPRIERLTAWLEATGPDVLCLQELKCTAEQFPAEALRELGYEAAVHADGRWNGVAVLSRAGVEEPVTGLAGGPEFEGKQEPRAVSALCGGVRVWSVYVPNGREVSHPHYAYKLRWLEALRKVAEQEAGGERPFAVLGDFNIAPTDEDVWDITQFEGATHVTEAERAALAALRSAGLDDVHPRPLKYDVPFTYWDYRQLCFPKNRGMRIDLVYGNAPFRAAVRDAYVDREARKGKGPSDHAPVVVDLELGAG
ncbi:MULTISPECIES: exodeoxyribonuclease III [unclassified Streptomyces]|uniref:exodeoxyribonuclease III n=1 Tax=unclassified Streptomyces TaxID=2593676 RepID=UPI0022B63943|nr:MULTISPECIES: exodeoxyribonuclease III [unclassified Streptomyces]MCZ7415860.1 exodeoxyribonuclease III [Streptomyces sp. WMMC897]MCZ7434331.1 exodeoxyribonuclease III [Streptomyces sp. WMMC1477]